MKRGLIILFAFLATNLLLSIDSTVNLKQYQVPVYGQDSLLVKDSLNVTADIVIQNYEIDSINVYYLNPAVRSVVTKYIFRNKNTILVDAFRSQKNNYRAIYVLKRSKKPVLSDSLNTIEKKIDYFALVDSVLKVKDLIHRKYNISEGFHYDGYHEFNKVIRRDGMIFFADKVSLPLYFQTLNRFYSVRENESTMLMTSKYYELEPMMVKAYMATGDYNYDFIVLEAGKDKVFGKDIQFRFDYVGFDGELYGSNYQVADESNGSMHFQLKFPTNFGEIETRYIHTRQKVPEKKVLKNPVSGIGNESYYTREYSLLYRSELLNINYKHYTDKLDSTEVTDNIFTVSKDFNLGNHHITTSGQAAINSNREFTGAFVDYEFESNRLTGLCSTFIGQNISGANGKTRYKFTDMFAVGFYADYIDRDVEDILSLGYEDIHYKHINSGMSFDAESIVKLEAKTGYSINEMQLKYVTANDNFEIESKSLFMAMDVSKALRYRQFVLNSEIGLKYESEKFFTDSEISLSYELKHNNKITCGLRYQFDDNTLYYVNSDTYYSNYVNVYTRLHITKYFSATAEFRNITDETQIYRTDLMPVHFLLRLKWYFFN